MAVVVAARPLVGFASATRAVRAQSHGLRPGGARRPAPRVGLHVVWRTGDRSPVLGAFLAGLAACEPFAPAV